MKNKALLFLIGLLASLSLANGTARLSSSLLSQDPPEVIVIPMNPIITNPSGGPRTLDSYPFIATFYPNSSFVCVRSSSPCGEVNLTLSSTAGDFYQILFDTEDGSILVPISGNSGCYTIMLVTASGQVYEGEFSF